jgi:hypothetical protein
MDCHFSVTQVVRCQFQKGKEKKGEGLLNIQAAFSGIWKIRMVVCELIKSLGVLDSIKVARI